MDQLIWAEWWRDRGESQLTLLLWALWNPIGTCPPDEYGSFSSPVGAVLREAHGEDAPLAINAVDDDVQRQRNALWQKHVERVQALLAELRETQIGTPLDPATERNAAVTLVDWHEWEMRALRRASASP